jgi:dihydroxyacid dehydratase/phosphogluconate dehydratase
VTASGGPLALIRTGDRMRLSVKRTIDLLIDAAELESRCGPGKVADLPARVTRHLG